MRWIALALAVGCGGDAPEPLLVLGAASTAAGLDASTRAWSASSGVPVVLSTASSSTLARQVQAGADAALLLSANEAWADALVADGLVDARVDLLTNTLVLIAPPGAAPPRLAALPAQGCVAMGDPAHVPGGQYAKAALVAASAWDGVADRVAPAVDAPAAVVLVARGECPVGVVYATDAAATDVVTGDAVPSPTPVVYPLLRLSTDAGRRPEAAALYAWLRSDAGLAPLRALGFGAAP